MQISYPEIKNSDHSIAIFYEHADVTAMYS